MSKLDHKENKSIEENELINLLLESDVNKLKEILKSYNLNPNSIARTLSIEDTTALSGTKIAKTTILGILAENGMLEAMRKITNNDINLDDPAIFFLVEHTQQFVEY